MTRFKMPPAPRLPFCWECSRRLYGTSHRKVVIDGVERIVHAACVEVKDKGVGLVAGQKQGKW